MERNGWVALRTGWHALGLKVLRSAPRRGASDWAFRFMNSLNWLYPVGARPVNFIRGSGGVEDAAAAAGGK